MKHEAREKLEILEEAQIRGCKQGLQRRASLHTDAIVCQDLKILVKSKKFRKRGKHSKPCGSCCTNNKRMWIRTSTICMPNRTGQRIIRFPDAPCARACVWLERCAWSYRIGNESTVCVRIDYTQGCMLCVPILQQDSCRGKGPQKIQLFKRERRKCNRTLSVGSIGHTMWRQTKLEWTRHLHTLII